MVRTAPIRERFWEKVAPVKSDEECWIWTAAKNGEGYGTFYLEGQWVTAHRVAYIMEHGPLPSDLVLDHLCRVPSCVNPSHLEPVSNKENILRGIGWAATRAAQTHCLNGHRFEGYNIIVTSKGGRECRTCKNRRQRERMRAVRANRKGQ